MKKLSALVPVLGVLSMVFALRPAMAVSGAWDDELPGVSMEMEDPSPRLILAEEAAAEEEFPDFLEDEEEGEMLEVADPIYYFNKAMYHFNDKLYFWVAKPLARGYGWLVPEVARRGVSNFFFNIRFPIRLVNSILQGKGNDVGMEVGRFVVNTTVGVLGFRNAAKDYPELNPPVEDTGQTFGRWGIGNGFYIVWPFLGPSTLRDTVGLVGDYFLHPTTYLIDDSRTRLGVTVYEKFNDLSLSIGDYESLIEGAIDPYLSIRDAYIQHRHKLVNE